MVALFILHNYDKETLIWSIQQMNSVKNSWNDFDKHSDGSCDRAISDGGMRTRPHQNILDRGQTADMKRHVLFGELRVHCWLLREDEPMDPYALMPSTNGYESTVDGLDAAYLQRIEQFWIQNQDLLGHLARTDVGHSS